MELVVAVGKNVDIIFDNFYSKLVVAPNVSKEEFLANISLSKKEQPTQDDLNNLVKKLNAFLEQANINCKFSFILHSSSLNQETFFSIFEKIRHIQQDNDVFENIYLDVTNGFRIIPLFIFFTVQCLSFLRKDSAIKGIYYGQTYSSSADTALGPKRELLNRALTIINKIRYKCSFLSEEERKLFQEKFISVNSTVVNGVNNSYEMSSLLGMDKLFNQTLALSQYDVSGNLDVLLPYITKNNQELFSNISVQENFIKFGKAKSFAQKLLSNVDAIFTDDAMLGTQTRVKEHLDIFKLQDIVQIGKDLAALFYDKQNFVNAILFFCAALEQASTSNKIDKS